TAVDGHVQRLLGGLQAAGGVDLLGADHPYTGTQLEAGGQLAVLAGSATGLTTDLVQQVLELGAIALEADRRDVRQVVGNGRQVHVLSGQAGLAHPQGRKHLRSPCAGLPTLKIRFVSSSARRGPRPKHSLRRCASSSLAVRTGGTGTGSRSSPRPR